MTSIKEEDEPAAKRQKISKNGPVPHFHCKEVRTFYVDIGNTNDFRGFNYYQNKLRLIFASKVATAKVENVTMHHFSERITLAYPTIPHTHDPNVDAQCVVNGTIFKFISKKLRVCKLASSYDVETDYELSGSLVKLKNSQKWIAEYDPTSRKVVLLAHGVYSVLDEEKKQWVVLNRSMSFSSVPDCATMSSKASQMFVFDRSGSLRRYNILNDEWSDISIVANSGPKPRHKAALRIEPEHEKVILLYGGCLLNTDTLWKNDLWAFHIENSTWSRILLRKALPCVQEPALCHFGNHWILFSNCHPHHGSFITLQEIETNMVISFSEAICMHSMISENLVLTDVKILLKDGSANAHYFALGPYTKLNQMIEKNPASNSSQFPAYTLNLSKFDLSTAVFQEYLLMSMYDQYEVPAPKDFIETMEAAKHLGLENYLEFLDHELDYSLNHDKSLDLTMTFIQRMNDSYMPHLTKLFASRTKEQILAIITEIQKRQITVPLDFMMKLWEASVKQKPAEKTQQEHHPFFTKAPNKMSLQQNYDVFLCDREETVRIGAHRAILAVNSGYFKTLFTSPFHDSEELKSGSKSSVVLNCSAAPLQILMRLLYNYLVFEDYTIQGESLKDNVNTLFEVIKLADEFMMSRIFTKQLIQRALQYVSPEELLELYNLTESMNLDVWEVIMSTFDSEDLKQLFDKRTNGL